MTGKTRTKALIPTGTTAIYRVPLAMIQRQPHKCPCCDGYGRREIPQAMATKIRYEQCGACKGAGIVWEPKP